MNILNKDTVDILRSHEDDKQDEDSQEYAYEMIRFEIKFKLLLNHPGVVDGGGAGPN